MVPIARGNTDATEILLITCWQNLCNFENAKITKHKRVKPFTEQATWETHQQLGALRLKTDNNGCSAPTEDTRINEDNSNTVQ